MKHISSLIIICLFILSSCSLQKRVYTKGFYTSNHQGIKKPKSILKKDTVATISLLKNISLINSKEKQSTLLAQVSRTIKKKFEKQA